MANRHDLECCQCGEAFPMDKGGKIHGEDYCQECVDDYNAEEAEDTDYGDEDGDIAYARLLNRSGVDRKCCYCGCTFTGMPDHGVCNSCADQLERGADLELYEGEDA